MAIRSLATLLQIPTGPETPGAVDFQRAYSKQLLQDHPVASVTQGIAEIVNGLVGGRLARRANQADALGASAATADTANMIRLLQGDNVTPAAPVAPAQDQLHWGSPATPAPTPPPATPSTSVIPADKLAAYLNNPRIPEGIKSTIFARAIPRNTELDPTAKMQEYEAAKRDGGFKGTFFDYQQQTAGGLGGGINMDDVEGISDAIINGNQPPVLTGLYRLGGPVRAALERKGYDFTKASQDWTATSKLLATMNGAQQTRLRQAVGQVKEALPLVRDLAEKWNAGGFPILNKAQLAAAKEGVLGPEAQSIAVQLEAEIADITSELGTVYKGGNSSTDESLKLAATQLNASWSYPTLLDAIKLAEKNIGYRENSLQLGTAGLPQSQYNQVQPTPEIAPGTVPVGGVPEIAAPAVAPPKVVTPPAGTIEDGYKFKGGDPSKPENWEQVK